MAYLKPLSKIGWIEIVKLGQSKLLLDRLQLLGDGATDAERRRGWAEEVERMAARDERGKHRQCAFARVVLWCATDLANWCKLKLSLYTAKVALCSRHRLYQQINVSFRKKKCQNRTILEVAISCADCSDFQLGWFTFGILCTVDKDVSDYLNVQNLYSLYSFVKAHRQKNDRNSR